MMGEGYFVEPTDGAIFTPVAGKISTIFQQNTRLASQLLVD